MTTKQAEKATTNGNVIATSLPSVLTFLVKMGDDVFEMDAVHVLSEAENIRFEAEQPYPFEDGDDFAERAQAILATIGFKLDDEYLSVSDLGVHVSAERVKADGAYSVGNNWCVSFALDHKVPMGGREYRVSAGAVIVTKRRGKDDEHKLLILNAKAILVPLPRPPAPPKTTGTVRKVSKKF